MERGGIPYHVPPFSLIVGHDLLKKALLYVAVDPTIGGVLVRGEKGTGKTTAVRAFARVLPEKEVVSGCRFGCLRGGVLCVECTEKGDSLTWERRSVEVVELPLNATEDRVVGSIDVESALVEGVKRFEMGVLGEANGNVLYIDEVNLLEDHIVDVLLDVSVSGVNRVRREGVRYDHPSRFILVGSMNPEEGELRPQFLDRFGLCVEVSGFTDPYLRGEVVKRVLCWEGEESVRPWEEEDSLLRERVETARRRLPGVDVEEEVVARVCGITAELGVAGMRGDINVIKVAKASAAFRGLQKVDREGLKEGFSLALPHRLKTDPFAERDRTSSIIDALLEKL